MTIVVHTSTKMPYSKLPIQRASSTWLTKAMTALISRIAKAISEMRPASPRSSAVKIMRVEPVEQRPRAQRKARRQKPVSRHGGGKAHALLSVFRASTLSR